jgi:hypothetical protein
LCESTPPLILLNMADGDLPYCFFVIAELPHKEAATLTSSLRIPGSGGSFMQPPQMRLYSGQCSLPPAKVIGSASQISRNR